jgi:peptide chain release factor 1
MLEKAVKTPSFSLTTLLRCILLTARRTLGLWSVFDHTDSSYTFLIEGNGVKQSFALEPGIHRVQRVPPTEHKGRRQTSTIAVAILPSLSKSDLNIPDSEFIVEATTGRGPGGQHRNRNATAIKITHVPTGISAYSDMKSQYRNREAAMQVVLARIAETRQQTEQDARSNQRLGQIGNMGRGTRVRTYNFIEGRVRDERVRGNFKVNKIMNGNLDLIYKKSGK